MTELFQQLYSAIVAMDDVSDGSLNLLKSEFMNYSDGQY